MQAMVIPSRSASARAVTSSTLVRPLCFLVDEDFSIRQSLASQLRRHDIDVVEFVSCSYLEMTEAQRPDIVFIAVMRSDPHKCVRALSALKDFGYSGPVQLFGRADARLIESFNLIGADRALTMLPPLPMPIEFGALRRIILDQKLAAAADPGSIPLDVALARNMVKFHYQPKLDLRTGIVVGAELLARVEHPELGLLAPDRFLARAHEDSLLKLAKLAFVEAADASSHFLDLGVALQLSLNVGAINLSQLPVDDLTSAHRLKRGDWPGLTLEVPVLHLANKSEAVRAYLPRLQQSKVSLAIDNFGLRAFQLGLLNRIPVSEIKIDRTLIDGCSVNADNARICQTIIQMAHNFGCKAIAVGISTRADQQRLMEMDCDVGQGFLFGKPMDRKKMDALIASFKGQAQR